MTRRVLVSGYYGAGNLGDEALLAGLLRGLARHARVDVTVLSAAPDATRALHGVPAASRTLGAPGALVRSRALISGGGGLLQDATSTRSLDYYLALVRAARLLRRTTVVYGQSLGPLSSDGRGRVRRALAGVPLGLRDEPSRAIADELGLPSVAVGDPALLLAPSGRPRSQAAAPPGSEAARLVLVPRGGYAPATRAMAGLARRAGRLGMRVEAAAFHPALDEPEVARLCELVPAVARLQVGTPAGAVDALAGAALVVSARLHGLILAAAAGAPHAGIAYDPKVSGFALQSGAPCWDVPADDRGEEALAAALADLFAAPPLDAERVDAARRLADDGVRWLAGQLGAGANPLAS